MDTPHPRRLTLRATDPRPDPLLPVHCAVGDTLREIRVLSEAEWEALPPDRRPSPAEYVPGLGWVVAAMPGQLK